MSKNLKRGLLLTSIAIISIVALYNGIVIQRYVLQTEKIPQGSSLRIVLITDLHSSKYGKGQSELLGKIKVQNPGVILLAGDIEDDRFSDNGANLLLKGLQGVAPLYYVSGNHEYWSGKARAIKETFRSYGVTVLEDEYQAIQINDAKIILAGIDDPDEMWYGGSTGSEEQRMDEAFQSLEGVEGYKILMAHRPERIARYKEYPFDLVVSGHAHGGQVRIPYILNGLYSPNQGWFPDYAGGLYQHESLTHIVSRGLSYNPALPRVFNPPELVVIDIEG